MYLCCVTLNFLPIVIFYTIITSAPLSCELTVTNLTQSSMDCLSKKKFVFNFTDVTEGDEYNYTITNVIGSSVKTGSIGT